MHKLKDHQDSRRHVKTNKGTNLNSDRRCRSVRCLNSGTRCLQCCTSTIRVVPLSKVEKRQQHVQSTGSLNASSTAAFGCRQFQFTSCVQRVAMEQYIALRRKKNKNKIVVMDLTQDFSPSNETFRNRQCSRQMISSWRLSHRSAPPVGSSPCLYGEWFISATSTADQRQRP